MPVRYFEKTTNRLYYLLITYHKYKLTLESGIYGTQKPRKQSKTFSTIKDKYNDIKKIIQLKKSQNYKELRGDHKLKRIENRHLSVRNSGHRHKLNKKNNKKTNIPPKNKKYELLSPFPGMTIQVPKSFTPKTKKDILLKKNVKFTNWEGNFNDL